MRILLLFIFIGAQTAFSEIKLSTNDLKIILGEKENVTLQSKDTLGTLQFIVQHDDIVGIEPDKLQIIDREANKTLTITAKGAGHSEIYSNFTEKKVNVADVYLRVTVYKNHSIDVISLIIGWVYFVAWSISFYPQIYSNYKRKSVIGLNFDFVYLNLMGHGLYALFNLGLFTIPEIKEEYVHRYPRGLNPVLINDIFFSVHATLACIFTVLQTFCYDRGDQRVSTTAKTILVAFGGVLILSIILSLSDVLHWLDFLYICSYIKLVITLIKYVPQAYMNYKRKSTVGWSIGNIFLDFTGGILSMMQMLFNAYNYDDWMSIFGDPTKFGLGLFSVIFDIFFIIQHYILYKNTNYEES